MKLVTALLVTLLVSVVLYHQANAQLNSQDASGTLSVSSSPDDGYQLVTSMTGFAIEIPNDWYLDRATAYSGLSEGQSILFRAPDGRTLAVQTFKMDRLLPGTSGFITRLLQSRLQDDKQKYLNYRLREEPFEVPHPSDGSDVSGLAEDRYTDDNGADRSNLYLYMLANGAIYEFDYSWTGNPPDGTPRPKKWAFVPVGTVNGFAMAVGSPISVSSPASISPAPRASAQPFGDGTYIIGTDIGPGRYRAAGGPDCYWARLSGFGGTLGEIIANDAGHTSPIVTIAASDAGFATAGCGTWSPG